MPEKLIDPIQVELLIIECKYNPDDADEQATGLIALYRFQQQLIRQWENQTKTES